MEIFPRLVSNTRLQFFVIEWWASVFIFDVQNTKYNVFFLEQEVFLSGT